MRCAYCALRAEDQGACLANKLAADTTGKPMRVLEAAAPVMSRFSLVGETGEVVGTDRSEVAVAAEAKAAEARSAYQSFRDFRKLRDIGTLAVSGWPLDGRRLIDPRSYRC
jgi:hypothetical protein